MALQVLLQYQGKTILNKNNKENRSNPSLDEYLGWDIYIWQKALNFWSSILKQKKIEKGLALEIGSKSGGLSLYLSHNFDFNVICSDITELSHTAKDLHKKYGVEDKVSCSVSDAVRLNFNSEMFDAVILKSVLGSIGKNENIKQVHKAVDEIYRVLKPGGIFLFAENAKGTFFHSALRKIFRKWAAYWKYFSKDEISSLLEKFRSNEIRTAGIISAFFPGNKIKKIILPADNFSEKMLPEKFRYMIYGYAVK